MSGLVPSRPDPLGPDPAHPTLEERELDAEERRRLTEVRAASWRARELAEAVFGKVCGSALRARSRPEPPRGLLRLDVPFDDLRRHRARERVFLAAVGADPLLSKVPLVYVVGPDGS